MSVTPSTRFHADWVVVVVVVQVWWVLLERVVILDGMMAVVEGAVGAVGAVGVRVL